MTDADSTPPNRRARLLRRLGRWAIVLWFAGLLAVPPVLLLAGLRPAEVENRSLAEAPGLSFGRLFDTDWYAGIATWFTDRLPARDRAIEADAWIDFGVFGESPNPDVLLGSDDWLYLRAGAIAPCLGEAQLQAAVEEVARAERALALAGKGLLLIVAPNKDAIYPEHLGGHAGETGCAEANRAAFRSLMSAADLSGYLDTWATLGAAKAAGSGLLYHRLDTHWTSLGAGVVGAAALGRITPGLWDPAALVLAESKERRGDLTVLIGLPLTEIADYWNVERAVTPVMTSEPLGGGVGAVVSTVEGIPTTGNSALMLHDSTGNALARILHPYFDALTTVRFREDVGSLSTGAAWFGEGLRDADLLILVSVERSLFPRLRGGLAADVVGALADLLPHRDLPLSQEMTGPDLGTRWAAAAGEIVTTGTADSVIRLPDLGPAPGVVRYLVVRLAARNRATEVRLSWTVPTDDRVQDARETVNRGAASVVIDLSAVSVATQLELHLGARQGVRVSQMLIVEVPSS